MGAKMQLSQQFRPFHNLRQRLCHIHVAAVYARFSPETQIGGLHLPISAVGATTVRNPG
jgi:hypothetical protein